MSFPRYPEYKVGDIEWLGEVPSHWRARPLWSLFHRTKRLGNPDEQLLSVYRDFGVIPKASRDDNFNKPSDDLAAYQFVAQGDLVVNKMKAWQGSVAISEFRGIVSPAYFVYRSNHAECARYLHYLMRSPRYVAGYFSMSKGIRVNQWDLDPAYHSRMPILLPPLQEQMAIAAFLDSEIEKLVELVVEQEKLIKLLEEKRQALISDVVTKGIAPNTPMKNFGIEWLGHMPVHWEVRMLSSLSTKITNGYVGPTRDILVEDGVRYLQSLHIKGNAIRFDTAYYVRQEWSDAHSKSILEPGDVLIVQTGDIGQVAVVTDEFAGCNCHALIIVAPLRNILTGEWLSWVLNSDYGLHSLLSIQTGALHPHLNCGNVKHLFVPLPPIEEQRQITDFIAKKSREFDALVAEARRAIALLKERRSALISAAVTGKIDVRKYVVTNIR